MKRPKKSMARSPELKSGDKIAHSTPDPDAMRHSENGFLQSTASDAAEVLYIPVEGMSAHYGVFLYYAVLAYPSRGEWTKRKEFVHAARAMLLKGAISEGLNRKLVRPDYRKIKNEKMYGTISRCLRRIMLRLNAGSMGYCMCLDGSRIPFTSAAPEGPPGIEIRAPNTVKKAAVALLKQAELTNVHHESDSARENIRHRTWSGSLPVLHLALSLRKDIEILRQVMDPAKALFALLHKRMWLAPAVDRAEELRLLLPNEVPSFLPTKSICILPSHDPLKIYRP